MSVRCESCSSEHLGEYGSGRFCSSKCARGFSTKTKRADINRKVRAKLKGRKSSLASREALRKAWAEGKFSERKRPSVVVKPPKGNAISVSLQEYHQQRRSQLLEDWKSNQKQPRARQCRSLLIMERGARCERCGWDQINPITQLCPIELEHIDGDCYNNRYENLCLLCPNCHSLTPTYRALNVGKGKGRVFYKLVSAWAKTQNIVGVWADNPQPAMTNIAKL